MIYRMLQWGVSCILMLLCGCATVPSQTATNPDFPSVLQAEDILPKNPTPGLPDQFIRNGIKAFRANDFTEASSQFNQALRHDPRNSYIQFLNALTYHLRAESGEVGQYELARVGYELALKFDKNNHLASQQLGHYYLKNKNYKHAQEYFAHTLLYQPDNAELLYGLAKASYYLGDLETAWGAIRRAYISGQNNPGIISGNALISAALGESESAKSLLAEFRTIEPAYPRVERVEDRIREWEELHRSERYKSIVVAAADVSQAVEPDPWANVKTETPTETKTKTKEVPASASPDPKMVVIDVALIRTEENESTNRGLNLLDGLVVQFGGTIHYQESIPKTAADSISRALSGMITLPDIKYDLNIFNSNADRNEVLARPTIIALDGKESKFFAGTTLNVAITGTEHGTLEKIDTGILLQVTPTFLPDESIQLSVLVSRSSQDIGSSGKAIEIVNISKNEITANVIMKYGQTLVLSGLREKEVSEGKSGVPLLMDIPFVQYLFSNKKTKDSHKTILVLLTPRRVLPGVNISDNMEPRENELKSLKEFRERYHYLFQSSDNLSNIMQHAEKHKILREMVIHEIRDTDLSDLGWWGSIDSLNTMLKRAVSFLYY